MPVMTEEGAEASDLAEVENDAAVDGVVDSAGGDTGAADADETVPPEETVAPDEAAPVKPKRGLPNVKTLALAAVLAVLVVAVGVLGWQAWQQHQINQARDEALHAAVSYAEVLTIAPNTAHADEFVAAARAAEAAGVGLWGACTG